MEAVFFIVQLLETTVKYNYAETKVSAFLFSWLLYTCFSGYILCLCDGSHSGVLRMQKLRPPMPPELTNLLPLKLGGSRSEYSLACFTCCQEFLHCPDFCLSGPFTFIFSKPSPCFLTVFWITWFPRVGSWNKIGHSAS